MKDTKSIPPIKLLSLTVGLLIVCAVVGSLFLVVGNMLLVMAAAACQSDPGLNIARNIWLGVYVVSALLPPGAYVFKQTRKATILASLMAFGFLLLAFASIFFSFLSVCQNQIAG